MGGTPSSLGQGGYPGVPLLILDGSTPPSAEWGTPPSGPGMGYPPSRPGTPPPFHKCGQTETITFRHPWDVGGKKLLDESDPEREIIHSRKIITLVPVLSTGD